MSYEIVKSIKMDEKTMTVTGRSASNNVYPKTFEKWTNTFDRFESKHFSQADEFLYGVLYDILGGSLQLQSSVSKHIRYGVMKARIMLWEEANRRGAEHFWDIMHSDMDKDVVLSERILATYREGYSEKDVKVDAIIEIKEHGYFVKKRKYGFAYTRIPSHAKGFQSRKEVELTCHEDIHRPTEIIFY